MVIAQVVLESPVGPGASALSAAGAAASRGGARDGRGEVGEEHHAKMRRNGIEWDDDYDDDDYYDDDDDYYYYDYDDY